MPTRTVLTASAAQQRPKQRPDGVSPSNQQLATVSLLAHTTGYDGSKHHSGSTFTRCPAQWSKQGHQWSKQGHQMRLQSHLWIQQQQQQQHQSSYLSTLGGGRALLLSPIGILWVSSAFLSFSVSFTYLLDLLYLCFSLSLLSLSFFSFFLSLSVSLSFCLSLSVSLSVCLYLPISTS